MTAARIVVLGFCTAMVVATAVVCILAGAFAAAALGVDPGVGALVVAGALASLLLFTKLSIEAVR